MKTKEIIISMVETAILVALAVVLDLLCKLIPFFNMPQGGHISLSMLPIIVIGFRRGWKFGLAGGFIYAIMNFLMDGVFWHIGSIFFDYLIPFTLLGLSGFVKEAGKSKWKIIIVILVVCTIRYVSHGLSGALFFAEYAYIPEELGWSVSANALPWVYSFIIYNLPYMGLSTVFCIVVAEILQIRNIIYLGVKDNKELINEEE